MNKRVSNISGIDEMNSLLWDSRYNDPDQTRTKSESVLEKANKAAYPKGIAYARLTIGASCFLQSMNDIALENLSEALLWFSKNPSERGYAQALNLKGNLYESFGDYDKALQFCLLAHKHATQISDIEAEAEICSQLGMIYTRLCNFEKALEYNRAGLAIREELKDENAVASSLNRLGMLMRLTAKFDQSLEYYFKSLEIRRRNKQFTSVPWTLLGIASTYEEMKKLSEALEYYEKGITGSDKRCSLQCLMGSGRIYSLMGDYDKAKGRLEESLRSAKDLKAMSLIAEAYSSLANHYESSGEVSKALNNFKLYQKTRETVQSEEARNRLRNIEISHAVEKSEQEKEIYRLKHVELKAAYNTIEEKNKDITGSINYASRIQRAMLPDPDDMEEFSKDLFILYLPKDIVSGDFYWFNNKGEKTVIVAADCTGHGVPGALMSMLGMSFLEEIVNNRGILEPGIILDELRKEVQRALHQKDDTQEAKDGMDISLCVIDKKKRNLQFAGAFNSLYLVRNDELIEFRADRMPIGISGFSGNNFTTQSIQTFPDDILYIFSDGYADQFGGPDNKKFKYSALKALLTEVHSLPLKKQEQILGERFREWKGESVQTDDVLVIGMKL